LDHRDRRAAERASEHDLQPRHRCNERFFQEAELTIPQQPDSGKDRCKQNAHGDDAGSNELKIAAWPACRNTEPSPNPSTSRYMSG
jgi:hypothetical protein